MILSCGSREKTIIKTGGGLEKYLSSRVKRKAGNKQIIQTSSNHETPREHPIHC